MERAIVRFSLDGEFAGIGELDGVADEINQDLRQAPAVAATGCYAMTVLEAKKAKTMAQALA
jgi:hypothetical protein